MKERPILFSAPMIRALLACTKTQTRRIVKPPRWLVVGDHFDVDRHTVELIHWENDVAERIKLACPYGAPGDRLWVRETWQTTSTPDARDVDSLAFAADWNGGRPGFAEDEWSWRPSIFMPRWASRLTLEVTGVRVERLHGISEADARAEGCRWSDGKPGPMGPTELVVEARDEFRHLWCDINGAESWDANPWVWVVEFKRVRP